MENVGRKSFSDAFLAGAASATVSTFLLQPLDMVKTRQQTTLPHRGLINLSSTIIRQEGLLSLWKGLTPSLARTVPGVGLYFSTLQTLQKSIFGDSRPNSMQTMALGCTARCTAGVLLMPMTVIKTRFESGLYAYSNIRSALKSILRVEGLVGLTSGTLPTLLRDVPFSGLYLMFYTEFKSIASRLNQDTATSQSTKNSKNPNRQPITKDRSSEAPSSQSSLACGLLAGLAACLITHPADVVKTRMQTSAKKNKSVLDVVQEVLRSEGLRGLLRGLAPRAIRRALMASMSWTLFEQLISKSSRNNS